jgi:DNA-binding response OmpR family regulator
MSEAKILIVDDDQDIRRLLGHRLKNEGFEAVFAGDAIAAVNAARKEEPDLILLDLGLPAGDGRLVMERMQAMPALEGIPVIIITARDVSMERESLEQTGAHTIFQKPFDHDELVAAIRSALG